MKMEQPEQIDPNFNADAYRNLTAADVPPVQDKQLEVIIAHKDDSLVVGASNMVDRYWNGTIWYFSDVNNFDRNHYTAAIRSESGVRVASYLEKHDKFVIGEDSGQVQIFELILNPESQLEELQCMGYSCQHDDSLTSMATLNDNVHIVTAGMDACIKVWDITSMIAEKSFNQAQTDVVTSVSVQPESNAVFVSTSMDCEALLWDTRKSKPALGVFKKNCGLTASNWKPNDDNLVAIGAIDGSISILDLRNICDTPLHSAKPFPREVHKLLFNPNQPAQLAACCNSTEVKVFNISKECESIFENNSHKDFVRGVAWYKNDLITCSWDNTLLRHSITSK